MFNISNKSFLFFIFFLGFSFLSLPSFANLITESAPYFPCHSEKMIPNFKSIRSLIFTVSGFWLLGLGIAALLNNIKWRWVIALATCLALEIVIRLLDFTSHQRSSLIFFVGGGFGLLGLAIAALLKKIKWRWVIALPTCLAIVLLVGEVVDYITQSDVEYEYTPEDGIDDTWE